jgi:hypothetical protein
LPFLLLKNGSLKCTSPANKIGSIIFKASISSAEKKNTYNNSKNFAVEVIDQKTIALVTAINHPDVAALKRSIESNAAHSDNC